MINGKAQVLIEKLKKINEAFERGFIQRFNANML
jgi:hypothetical protein